MAFTAQQLADIQAAYATGALTVDTPNMRTTFRSLVEMEQIIASIQRELAGNTSASRSSFASYSRD